MGEAKKLQVTVVLGLSLVVALLLLSSVVQADAAAMKGMLDYHMMAADQENGKNKALFRPGPGDTANVYTRGCETIEKCRAMAR